MQNMVARMVTGRRRCDGGALHWLPVSRRVVFKTVLMVWKCIHGVTSAYVRDLCIPATVTSGREKLRSAYSRILLVPRVRTAAGQQSSAVSGSTTWNRSAAWTMSTTAVTERFHTCTDDAAVLIRPSDFLRDSGAEYKYTYLLNYLLTEIVQGATPWIHFNSRIAVYS